MLVSVFGPTLLGIILICGGTWLFSTQRWRVDWGLVLRALCLQGLLALLFTQVPQMQAAMVGLGAWIEQLQGFAEQGAAFVFGGFVSQPEALGKIFSNGGSFIFALKLLPVIVFVAALVSVAYYWGLLQAVVKAVAWAVNVLLGVSGAEAISNGASIFVGQVEAQLLVKPYLKRATESELLAMMAGSFACISGGMMAVYIGMGISASYLITASVMAIPGGFAVAKILIPETLRPMTQGKVQMVVEQKAINVVDAAAQGASEGWHIAVSVLAMLIAFISLVAFVDAGLGWLGHTLLNLGLETPFWGFPLDNLTLASVMSEFFYFVALGLGIPASDALNAASLLGTKMMLNEFVAYSQYLSLVKASALSPLSQAILAVALCGFANLGSIAIQLGGIGAMVPERRQDIAGLGLKAMLCGTLASYLSATIMGGLFRMQESTTFLPSWLALALGLFLVVGLILSRLLPRPAYLGDAPQSDFGSFHTQQPFQEAIEALGTPPPPPPPLPRIRPLPNANA